MVLAGGEAYPVSGGVVRAANITLDALTGVGGWSREQFIERFKAMEGARDRVMPGAFNTIMPWTQYAGMTRPDLGAIYEYLRTVSRRTRSCALRDELIDSHNNRERHGRETRGRSASGGHRLYRHRRLELHGAG